MAGAAVVLDDHPGFGRLSADEGRLAGLAGCEVAAGFLASTDDGRGAAGFAAGFFATSAPAGLAEDVGLAVARGIGTVGC